jgi:hypothetical protein
MEEGEDAIYLMSYKALELTWKIRTHVGVKECLSNLLSIPSFTLYHIRPESRRLTGIVGRHGQLKKLLTSGIIRVRTYQHELHQLALQRYWLLLKELKTSLLPYRDMIYTLLNYI